MTTLEKIRSRREEILGLARKHDARNVRIFGSIVRGEERPDSDVDFLVEIGPNPSPFFPGGFLADLEELLGRPADIVTEKALHRAIRDQVLKEAVPL